MAKDISIEEALRDLKVVRSAIERLEGPGLTEGGKGTLLTLQFGAFVLAGVLLLREAVTGQMTLELIYSAHDPIFRIFGIVLMSLFLVLLIIATASILSHGAKRNDESLERFVRRNFQNMNLLSFSSDLVCKLAAVTLIIMAGKPEWVGPILILFTADYLFQGRLFGFSIGISIFLGLGTIVAGLLQIFSFNPSLILALSIFTILSGASAVETYRKMRRPTPSQEAA